MSFKTIINATCMGNKYEFPIVLTIMHSEKTKTFFFKCNLIIYGNLLPYLSKSHV